VDLRVVDAEVCLTGTSFHFQQEMLILKIHIDLRLWSEDSFIDYDEDVEFRHVTLAVWRIVLMHINL